MGGVAHQIEDHLLGGKRQVVSAAELSRAPLPWWERTDPYWQVGLFDAHHPWSCEPQPRIRSGPILFGSAAGAPPAETSASPAPGEAWEQVDAADRNMIGEWARLLGLVALAGVITGEQAEACAGPEAGRVLRQLAELGAVEGSWHHPPGLPHPRVLAWRTRTGHAFDAIVARLLFDGTLHEHFGGVHPLNRMPAVRHVRHQSLANELALRALESSERWVGWIPEAVCSPHRFAPEGHPARGRRQPMRADGCLIRVDGFRLFVEIQASTSKPKTEEKAARWGSLFAEGPLGGRVLFVAASGYGANGRAVSVLKDAVKDHCPPESRDRLLIGQWHDYSPDHCQITDDAWRLRAAARTGGRWQEVHAVDVEPDLPVGRCVEVYGPLNKCRFNPEWTSGRVPAARTGRHT